MAKHTAIRLENSLMSAAKTAAVMNKRTAVEQIEYWAELGRNVSKFIDTESLLACSAGLATLKVEEINAQTVDPDAVFNLLEKKRESGELASLVTRTPIRYQASEAYPGMLEKIDSKGKIQIGNFKNGVFVLMQEALN